MTPVFFWKCDKSNGWMSNWARIPVTEDGVVYHTTEHYLMCRKAILMGDEKSAVMILRADTPGAAKRLGRRIAPWDESKWVLHREPIMKHALRLKVTQNPDVYRDLMATGSEILAEASPDDLIWGIGCAAHDPRAKRVDLWPGQNLLGKCWMEVRSEFQSKT